VKVWCYFRSWKPKFQGLKVPRNEISNKSCALDPLPTTSMKEFLPELLPYLTDLCNSSLTVQCLPVSQRRASILPRLKKVGADSADVNNYWPISNLTFMSKVAFLGSHKLLPDSQSAYRKHHRTETAILKIVLDILQTANNGKVTARLLDMSAAFDTVDHDILLDRLHKSFGISGTVLSWIESFITGRTQAVHVGGDQSTTSAVVCGVPQYSILGPLLLLVLNTANVLTFIPQHGLLGQLYADDTSIYLHSLPATVSALYR